MLHLDTVSEAMPKYPMVPAGLNTKVLELFNSLVTLVRAGCPGASSSGDAPWHQLVRNGLKPNQRETHKEKAAPEFVWPP